ncbi:hypothetical protein ACFO4N_00295 [Camelliibacillus cellulosilyticus]|uniref:HPr domain-containing protein n=1 Tax=Camelliibacillus cellulosilyticus TaxID=2174486 RepID=A0ABV9GIV6_9BACL
MKSIVSFNVPIKDFNFVRAINFYFLCRKSGHNIYLYMSGKVSRIERMTQWVTFLLTSENERLLVVIEGHDAEITMKRLIKYLYSGHSRQVV